MEAEAGIEPAWADLQIPACLHTDKRGGDCTQVCKTGPGNPADQEISRVQPP